MNSGTCTPSTAGRECTVVIGTLNLFLNEHANLPTARYATRFAIRDAMLNDDYVGQIPGLVDVNYVAPNIIKPSDETDNTLISNDNLGATGYQADSNKSSFTRLEIVVAATLVSTIVGLIGSFVLFKKIYSKQNCMAPCDGTGIDKDFIENCHNLGVAPVGRNTISNGDQADKNLAWNMNSVMNTNNGVLGAIEENSISASDASLYSSVMSQSTGQSVAMKSVASMQSEQTMVIRNGRRNSTPIFGNEHDQEVSIDSTFLSKQSKMMYSLELLSILFRTNSR